MSMCFHIAKRSYVSASSASFVRDTLKTALPNINSKWVLCLWVVLQFQGMGCSETVSVSGSAEGCLQYLCQKAPNILLQRTSGHVTSGSPPIVVLQHATLMLLHCAYSHQDM